MSIIASIAFAAAISTDKITPDINLNTPLTTFSTTLQDSKAKQDANQEEKKEEKKEEAKEDEFTKAIKDHKKGEGVFNTYVKDNTIMFEVPDAMLGRDFLWYAENSGTSPGSYPGNALNEGVFRLEKRGDKIVVRSISFSKRSKNDEFLASGLARANMDPIIATLPIKASKEGGGHLVDVSRMFINGIPETSTTGRSNVDASRSFVESVHAFPENINIEVTLTTSGGQAAPASPFGGPAPAPSNTQMVHHSLVLLPEKPMTGRLRDSRVGYFSYPFTLFDANKNGTEEKAYIARYRLEKKDPSAALSEPVEPIVYYIAPEVPAKWRPYIKAGVEDWQVAFEAAGFKNAIICKEAPTKEQDPTWSPEDVRYSTIRWAPLPIANAMGPHVADPRSGEILSAHIIMWHDVLRLGNQWYFSQASPNDKRAQKFPFPDELTGEILQFVVAHEVGHTLGLPHNGKGSAMVPVDLLRDPKWTKENGTATSIMDYARFNYVAQPGDGAGLMAKIGPYDKFSIKWGYEPIQGATTPESEFPTLDAWAARQVNDPMLRFYDNFSGVDPTAQSEALGDDAVKASTYGISNLKRVMGYLVPAATKTGESYDDLQEAWGSVFSQYNRYIGHVLVNVGGVIETNYHAGRGGNVYNHVDKAMQKASVKWLSDYVLTTPSWLVPDNILAKLGTNTGSNIIASAQSRVINGLLSNSRLTRMLDNESVNGAKAYTIPELMDDLRSYTWKELSQPNPTINRDRRAVQRTYVNALTGKLASPASDIRSYVLAEIQAQLNVIKTKLPDTKDAVTKAHLNDMRLIYEQALTFPPQTAAASGGVSFPFGANDEDWIQHDGCGICQATKPGK